MRVSFVRAEEGAASTLSLGDLLFGRRVLCKLKLVSNAQVARSSVSQRLHLDRQPSVDLLVLDRIGYKIRLVMHVRQERTTYNSTIDGEDGSMNGSQHVTTNKSAEKTTVVCGSVFRREADFLDHMIYEGVDIVYGTPKLSLNLLLSLVGRKSRIAPSEIGNPSFE